MSENTPPPAGLPGTPSAFSDSPRSDPAKTPDVPAAHAAAQNVAADGASPVTAASEPGAPGATGATADGNAATPKPGAPPPGFGAPPDFDTPRPAVRTGHDDGIGLDGLHDPGGYAVSRADDQAIDARNTPPI